MAAEGTTLAKAYVQIVPSAKGIKGSISSAMEGEASEAGIKSGNNFAGKLKGIIAAAGIGKVVKEALSAGGDLQQSYFGGLDTLYGEAADAARDYANQAVTAGISMNDYAEQAVSFGAALKQSLGGDTAAAVEAANTAILDMADNAAKMGTPLENIQNAYQGFAKQNYTMLDNLKLGYGGTKQEMERLLADAQALSGVEYNIDNLSDVYSAIHVIQEDLGLTGVAAEEASQTFTGSMQAMKAAATNLLAQLTTGGDVTGSLEVLTQTLMTFIEGNLLPMIGNLVSAVPELIKSMVPLIIEALQITADNAQGIVKMATDIILTLVETLTNPETLTSMIDAALAIITGLADGLLEAIPRLVEAIPVIIKNLLDAIIENLPKILTQGAEILKSLIEGLLGAIPQLIAALPEIISAIIDYMTNNLPQLIQMGIELTGAIVVGIIKAIPDILKSFVDMFKQIGEKIASLDWKSIGKNMIDGIVNGIKNFASNIGESIKDAASDALNGVKNFLGINSPSKVMRDQVGKWIPSGIAEGIENNTTAVTGAMDSLANDMTSPNIQNSLSTGLNKGLASGNTGNSEVLEMLARYLPEIASGKNVNVSLEGDAKGLFNAVRKESNRYTNRTGQMAFA